MSELVSLAVNPRQRDLLLRGLRFVRSSRMLEFRDSADITEEQRKEELQVVRDLMSLLSGTTGSRVNA